MSVRHESGVFFLLLFFRYFKKKERTVLVGVAHSRWWSQPNAIQLSIQRFKSIQIGVKKMR
jgi:hypothetical protein